MPGNDGSGRAVFPKRISTCKIITASAATTSSGLGLSQLSFNAAYPPPTLGIGTYAGQPAMYFLTFPGTNYVRQMTTNLTSGNWVTVTNGIPLSGVITNAPVNAFFRWQ